MRNCTKTILHPEVGPLALASEVLLDSTREQWLVRYTAQPGTDAAEKLELLRRPRPGEVRRAVGSAVTARASRSLTMSSVGHRRAWFRLIVAGWLHCPGHGHAR